MENIVVRKSILEDLPELLAIYNYEVTHGMSNLDIRERTLEEWEKWFYAHNIKNHPLYSAIVDGKVAGYASLSAYREKEGYRTTVELSIYIHVDYRRMGVATELLNVILEDARADERTHTVVSVIVSGNEASQKMHELYGFKHCGTIHEVGFKQGKFRDIDNYELRV